MARPSSDMAAFREDFAKAKHIVVLTGAGVSAESGVPTFRGAGGFWRQFQAQDLATPYAFASNPSLVWEFYHYRREVMLSKHPNPAHVAIAECEARLAKQGRRVVVITQNIDELHKRAGSNNIIELHGNLFKTRCTSCGNVEVNKDSPICPALDGKGLPDKDAADARIPEDQLPRCGKEGCGGLVRPHVVWFGEALDPAVLHQTDKELSGCDLCLVVGTSSVVYPAAMFAPQVAERGVPVAEFNIETTSVTNSLGYHFSGPAGVNVATALAPHPSEPSLQ
ncbi:NAD-dependent protein deacylase sirtuin-5, mitochondrial-like isoform X2 [Babylonia areolata]